MNLISLIILILLSLFLFEFKTINALLYFIALTLLVAILISFHPTIRLIDGEYLSYILILVQIGAISVLFGLIILLHPDPPSSSLSYSQRGVLPHNFFQNLYSSLWYFPRSLWVLLFSLSFFFFALLSSFLFPHWGYTSFFSPFHSLFFPSFSSFSDVSFPPFQEGLLFKIGLSLYTVPSFILKFLLLTIILLLAIVGLFFLILI